MTLHAKDLTDVAHMSYIRTSLPDWESIELHVQWAERRGLRPRTVASRREVCYRTTHRIGKALVAATDADIRQWWDAHQGVAGTRRFDLMHLRQFFRWAVNEGLRDSDPTATIATPLVRRGVPRPMSEDRTEAALKYAPAYIKPWIALAAYAGLRACEVASLQGEDIRHDLGVIIVREGKGGKQRAIPLHPIVAECLKDAPPQGPVFLKQRSNEPVSAHLVSITANRWLHRIGADGSFHTLRHRFATRVYAASGDLRVTQELLGHSNPQTTAIYTAISSAKAKSAVEAI